MISGQLDQLNSNIGILIIGHGSRNIHATKEFARLAEAIKSLVPSNPFEYGYLEFSRPIISEALDKLRERGVRKVIAIPAMLFAAGHAKNDIPAVLNSYSNKTGIEILYGRELGINNLMISAAAERIKEAVISEKDTPLNQMLLVVVGRGSSDPDANSNISKITRMLVESLGFGWGETVYSGVTFPLVEPGLRHLVKLDFRKVIVFPYFLFSGVLVSRIRNFVQLVAEDNPEIEFINASYLGDHPKVVDTFIERILEVLSGANAMNCALCKYRSNLFGFEKEVGLLQSSHHNHVEGIDQACSLCELECTGECDLANKQSLIKHSHSNANDHDHDHGINLYPNASHPLGPVTFRSSKEDQI